MKESIPDEVIERKIFLIRGQKVMLSNHLAQLYETTTSALIQAVKRNIERFPEDFMFLLTRQEIMNLSQFVISSKLKKANHPIDKPAIRRRIEGKGLAP